MSGFGERDWLFELYLYLFIFPLSVDSLLSILLVSPFPSLLHGLMARSTFLDYNLGSFLEGMQCQISN